MNASRLAINQYSISAGQGMHWRIEIEVRMRRQRFDSDLQSATS